MPSFVIPSFMRVTDTIDHGWLDYGLVQGEEYAVCNQIGIAFKGLRGVVSVEESGYTATIKVEPNLPWMLPGPVIDIEIYLDCVFAVLSGDGNNGILMKEKGDGIFVFVYGDMKRGLLFSNCTLVADDLLDKITLLAEQMEAVTP